MATLAEQRAAIAQGMAASRAPTAGAERRATGQRIIEERTGKSVAEDINRLVNPVRQRRSLTSVPVVGAVPAGVGRGSYKEPTATTGGIASPVTEPDFAAREFWPNGLKSSDGLFFMPAVKKIVAQDASGAEVIFEYAQPVPA